MATVRTYRVLRDGLKVGHDVRNFGDYMPEAAEFDNLRSLLNADFLEEVWIEEEVLEEWKQEFAQRSLDTEADEDDEETNDSDEDDESTKPDGESEEVTSPESDAEVKAKPKKKIKKTVKKKPSVKETGNALAEESV